MGLWVRRVSRSSVITGFIPHCGEAACGELVCKYLSSAIQESHRPKEKARAIAQHLMGGGFPVSGLAVGEWRVPTRSVIARVFAEGGHARATEDLSWWTTSNGSRLEPFPVVVQARKGWDSVQASLVPQI